MSEAITMLMSDALREHLFVFLLLNALLAFAVDLILSVTLFDDVEDPKIYSWVFIVVLVISLAFATSDVVGVTYVVRVDTDEVVTEYVYSDKMDSHDKFKSLLDDEHYQDSNLTVPIGITTKGKIELIEVNDNIMYPRKVIISYNTFYEEVD